jgi:hypothetical protein
MTTLKVCPTAIRKALDDFAMAYWDDVLIYSDSEKEHVGHVKWIMQQLLEAGLYLKPEKCEFHKITMRYLGLIISMKGISMDEDKVETVRNWCREKKTQNGRCNNLFEVQQFLGFWNYYQRFIRKYSEKAEPFTTLINKDEPFEWESEQQLAFETMVTAFMTALALPHFDHGREVIVETDASNYISTGVLSQHDDEGVLHPVAYYSKKHSPAKCNFDTYKELMVMIKALEEWRPESESAAYLLQLITDHKNLEYFMMKKLLNRRQARWSEFLTLFDYQIVFRPGKSNGKANALTRRPGDLPEEGDKSSRNMEQLVLKPELLQEQLRILANGLPMQDGLSISDLFGQTYQVDPLSNKILKAIQGNSSLKEITVAECIEQV